MARKLNQALWTQWWQRIERQRESGLSIAEFCRREHVSSHRFHVWKRKVRQGASVRPPAAEASGWQSSRKRRTHVRPRTHTALAGPATPTGATGFLQLPVSATRPSPWIELALADGTVVRLPQQNLTALVTVLRVLRGERLEASPEDGHA